MTWHFSKVSLFFITLSVPFLLCQIFCQYHNKGIMSLTEIHTTNDSKFQIIQKLQIIQMIQSYKSFKVSNHSMFQMILMETLYFQTGKNTIGCTRSSRLLAYWGTQLKTLLSPSVRYSAVIFKYIFFFIASILW